MIQKRHAILLCGFCRKYKENLEAFKENNRYRDDVDLFICFWDLVNAHPKPSPRLIKYENLDSINLDEIKEDYNPTDIKILNWHDFEAIIKPSSKIIEAAGLIGPNSIYGGKSHERMERTLATSFLISRAFDMMEEYGALNDIEYVNVLRARTEFGYYNLGGHYPNIDWDKECNNCIYIPNWNFLSRGGMTPIGCGGAFGNFDNMKIYCNLINELHELADSFHKQPKKCWGDEYCYSLHLTRHNIKWRPH